MFAKSQVMRVQKADMLRLLPREPKVAQFFWTHVLLRNHRTDKDLADQGFDSIERRLARARRVDAPSE
jgi:hypothetical protein